MKHFRIANWSRYQHYRDRNPPWVKLYTELLDTYSYAQLPDASKAHALGLMLLAARSNNHLPYDPAWLGNRLSATTTVDLEILQASGFIEVCDCASCLSAAAEHGASVAPADQPEPVEQVASGLLAKCSGDRSEALASRAPAHSRETEAEKEGETEERQNNARVGAGPLSSSRRERFEAWWKEYPRKDAKQAALLVWDRKDAKGELPVLDEMLAKLKKQKRSRQWLKDGGEFVPHGRKYLEHARFNDEDEPHQSSSPSLDDDPDDFTKPQWQVSPAMKAALLEVEDAAPSLSPEDFAKKHRDSINRKRRDAEERFGIPFVEFQPQPPETTPDLDHSAPQELY